MAKVTIVTGGQRSGKSGYAQKKAEDNCLNPTYIATARIWDSEFASRIERHKSERGEMWNNIEEEKRIGNHTIEGGIIVLDCITLWLTNIFFDNDSNIEKALIEAKEEWSKFIEQDSTIYAVTNEIGMGVIPNEKIARQFADLQGWVNQYIASTADSVILMVSGIPLKIK